MNSSSSSQQALNQRNFTEFMESIKQRHIERIEITEKRKKGRVLSYTVVIHFQLNKKTN